MKRGSRVSATYGTPDVTSELKHRALPADSEDSGADSRADSGAGDGEVRSLVKSR